MSLSEQYGIVRKAVRDTALHLMHGDLVTRRRSLEALGVAKPGAVPALLSADRLQAKLRFTLRIEEKDSWLFVLFTRKRTIPVTDIRVHFTLTNVVEPDPSSAQEPDLHLVPAPFLGPKPGGRGCLFEHDRIRIHAVRAGSGASFRADDGSDFGVSGWPAMHLVAVMDALRDWLEEGDAEPARYRPSGDTRLDRLVSAVSDAHRKLHGKIQDPLRTRSRTFAPLREHAKFLRRVHPDLLPRYDISQLDTRILLRIDDEGDILQGNGTTLLRVDLRAISDLEESASDLLLMLTLPDVLTVSRPFFDDFVDPLLDSRRQIVEAAQDALGRRETRRFLNSGVDRERTTVARVDLKEDRDLVLLRGSESSDDWLLLGVRYDVKQDWPEPEARVDEVQFLAGRLESRERMGTVEYAGSTEHLSRLFGFLLRWLEGLR